MLSAGGLSQRIQLQSKQVALDALNGAIVSWQTESDEWAAVEAITGREVHAASQLHSDVTLRVTIRQPGTTPDSTWRVLWNDAVLSIEAVLPHRDRDRLVLLCAQGLSEG